MIRIGVLALQGCVQPHKDHIEAAGFSYVEIKKPNELETVDGLIIPGGESTTFLKLLETFNFFPSLEKFFQSQKPVWGICAGAILIAKNIQNPQQQSLNWIPVTVSRNAYGRQLESFETFIWDYSVAFIRAPQFESVEEGVEILALDPKTQKPACLEYKQILVSSFHPELSPVCPSPFHQYFFKKVETFKFGKSLSPQKQLSPQLKDDFRQL